MSNKKEIKTENFPLIFVASFIILLLATVFAICIGKYEVKPIDALRILFNAITFKDQTLDQMTVNVVLGLRLPRILASIFIGGALSISGACYQGVFKNPLVSPDFLGVSGGACIGAAIAIVLGLNSFFISMFSFIGGIVAVLITVIITMMIRNRSNIILVLSGIIVSSLMSSILGFIKYTADPSTELASITYWTMGDFSYVSKENLLPMMLVLVPPIIVLILMSWWIDVLSMGAMEAKTLGANVKLIRAISIICSTLLTAGSICVAGTIGWVGLIIPHLSRLIVGSSNRRVIPISFVIGGLFMLIVDSLTRVLGSIEMPVSIMTGIIGAPIFFLLLFKKKDEVL